jgi:GNAT superfamily N-acetyltransferase
LSVRIREADESLFDDEIHLCLPPKDSPKYAAFQDGLREKRAWLRKRLTELGSVAQIAYYDRQPVAFIEYVSAEHAPVPVGGCGKTALITCIHKPEFEGKGVGSALLKAALARLRKLDIQQVKTLVSRNPKWINSGIYVKHGFRLEKTLHKPGRTEPLDILTLDIKPARMPTQGPATIGFEPQSIDSLPVHVVYFCSGQCPFNYVILERLRKVVAGFDARHVVLEVLDSWENCKLAQECGAMNSDLLVNGKMPFLGPPSEENMEEEIRKEIERVRALG